MAHPRLVVHAFNVPGGDDFHEVLIAVVVLGEKNQMVIFLVVLVFQFVVVMPGHIYLASYDRFYGRMLFRKLEELFHPVHVAVVGDGNPRHSEFVRTVEKIFNR